MNDYYTIIWESLPTILWDDLGDMVGFKMI
jgi:hypothetical protein